MGFMCSTAVYNQVTNASLLHAHTLALSPLPLPHFSLCQFVTSVSLISVSLPLLVSVSVPGSHSSCNPALTDFPPSLASSLTSTHCVYVFSGLQDWIQIWGKGSRGFTGRKSAGNKSYKGLAWGVSWQLLRVCVSHPGRAVVTATSVGWGSRSASGFGDRTAAEKLARLWGNVWGMICKNEGLGVITSTHGDTWPRSKLQSIWGVLHCGQTKTLCFIHSGKICNLWSMEKKVEDLWISITSWKKNKKKTTIKKQRLRRMAGENAYCDKDRRIWRTRRKHFFTAVYML